MNEKFINDIISHNYILWLNCYMLNNRDIDNVHYLEKKSFSELDLEYINNLKDLFNIIVEYKIINNLNKDDFFCHILNVGYTNYLISFDKGCYSCKRLEENEEKSSIISIKYEQLRKYLIYKMDTINNNKTLKKLYKFD